MKKLLTILITGIMLLGANCFNRVEAWVNRDIKEGLNAKTEKVSPEMRQYMEEVLKELKLKYRERGEKKDWQSQICFRIDKSGNIYDKNYVIKGNYWINEEVEYAMMSLNKVAEPPKEYKQEVIFITFKHKYPKTEIYYTNVNED